jgi:hypothetical protein
MSSSGGAGEASASFSEAANRPGGSRQVACIAHVESAAAKCLDEPGATQGGGAKLLTMLPATTLRLAAYPNDQPNLTNR